MIKSKFSFGRIYINYIFLLIFLAVTIYFLLHPEVETHTKFGSTMSLSTVGLIMLVVDAWLFYIVARWTNFITINSDQIIIKGIFLRKDLSKQDIQSIDLFAINNPGFINGSSNTITTEIVLLTGQKIIIPDLAYNNYYKLKSALYENYKEKIPSIPETPKSESIFYGLDETFDGSQFTCLNGILFYGVSLFFIIFSISLKTFSLFTFLFVFVYIIGLLYIVTGIQMYYFIIVGNSLVVKNHFWFWYKKDYDINTIIEMNFETPYRRSKALRITSNDFKSRLYSAGSLRDKTWQALKEKIDTLKIPYKI